MHKFLGHPHIFLVKSFLDTGVSLFYRVTGSRNPCIENIGVGIIACPPPPSIFQRESSLKSYQERYSTH
jgi:hypothetical protein